MEKLKFKYKIFLLLDHIFGIHRQRIGLFTIAIYALYFIIFLPINAIKNYDLIIYHLIFIGSYITYVTLMFIYDMIEIGITHHMHESGMDEHTPNWEYTDQWKLIRKSLPPNHKFNRLPMWKRLCNYHNCNGK